MCYDIGRTVFFGGGGSSNKSGSASVCDVIVAAGKKTTTQRGSDMIMNGDLRRVKRAVTFIGSSLDV